MLDQRRRRWADVLQMLYKCFVFAGYTRQVELLQNAYNCLLRLDSIGIENCTTHVKTITFNLNLGSFWETQTIERRCRFINNVKQQTEDKFING